MDRPTPRGRTGGRANGAAWASESRRVAPQCNPNSMAPRYVIRTVDEDWIDLFDERAALEEAKRRVGAHPECTTRIIDRHTGVTLWRSEPDVAPRYEVVAVDATVFHALQTDLPLPGDVLSAHTDRDDAWTAFYAAIAEPFDDIIVLRDTTPAHAILASSDEDFYRTDAESGR